jgi:uncharacterized protein
VTIAGPGSEAATATGADRPRCWRCGKPVAHADAACPHCGAPRRRRAERGRPKPAASPAHAVTGVLAFFGLLLLVLLVHGVASAEIPEKGLTAAGARERLWTMVLFEVVDALLVGVALWVVGRPRAWRRLSDAGSTWTWAAALAGGGLVLGANFAYHTALRAYIGTAPSADPIVSATGVTPLVVFAYCLEPAVVEELFFRYLTLDTLRGVMNVHAAVLVSSVLFGLAHIGVPLSIPMLALVGVALGYARVASGRLALPMALHFLHNLVVVALVR